MKNPSSALEYYNLIIKEVANNKSFIAYQGNLYAKLINKSRNWQGYKCEMRDVYNNKWACKCGL